MHRQWLILLVILAVYYAHIPVLAGPPDPIDENVLRPVERVPSYGLMLGTNFSISSGTLLTTCQCEYESGSGFGIAGAGFFELPFGSEFSIVGQILFDGLNATYTDTESRLEYIDDGDFRFIDFDKNTDVTLSYLSFEVLGKWNIGGRQLYVLAGPAIGSLVSENIQEDETIATEGFVFSTTNSSGKQYLDGSLDSLYDVKDLRISLRFGVGYEISIGTDMILAPEINYSLPFTEIVNGFKNPVAAGQTDVTDWKHSSIQLAIRLKFNLR